MLLLSGSCDLLVCDGVNMALQTLSSNIIEVMIQPNILHAFLPHEPVTFLEYRATVFNSEASDTYPAEIFGKYLLSEERKVNLEVLLAYQRMIRLNHDKYASTTRH